MRWLTVLAFFAVVSSACAMQPAVLPSQEWANPEQLAIQGYTGPQEDPVISPDGQWLFFDSHDDNGDAPYLFLARSIDYKTFQFLGRLGGINIPGVESCVDAQGNFYFVSGMLPSMGAPTTMAYGRFTGGEVSGVTPVIGIQSRNITYDLYITPDGNTLYFSDFELDASGKPQGAQLAMAIKNQDGSFTRQPPTVLTYVNTTAPLVYNATPSADGLEFAFNATPDYGSVGATGHIYLSKRASPSGPFGAPQLVSAADLDHGQLSEPGSFSPDGKHLYFHRVVDAMHSELWVLTKAQ